MKSLKRLIRYIFAIISVFFFLDAGAQDVEETFTLALRKKETGYYEEASMLFKRVAYFGDARFKGQSYLNMGDCHFLTGDFEAAGNYYESGISLLGNDPDIYYEYTFKKTAAFIKAGKFNLAEIEMLFLPDNPGEAVSARKNFYLGFIYLEKSRFKSARKHFLLLIDTTNTEQVGKLDNHLRNFIRWKTKSTRKAAIFSALVPGSGQLLAGNPREAINSFILTGGLIALTIYVGIEYSLIDAILSIAPWATRYYTGGIKKSEKLYLARKEKKLRKATEDLLEFFSNNSL